MLETKGSRQNRVAELKECFKVFDELMHLKKQMSKIFGVLLLISSAVDFMLVTIAVYGMLYYSKELQFLSFYYFTIYYLPIIVKCVLLAEALNTLGDQVGPTNLISQPTILNHFFLKKRLRSNLLLLKAFL